ncbi:MAG: HAMP domain-containing histidine kinase [Lachnospiraceae bacterium]|nr:HAMP domain-containing histidine kinase [Lachnospiraceae bacterium]
MKGKLFKITFLFAISYIFITGIFIFDGNIEKPQDRKAEQIIAVNEIEQLIASGNSKKAEKKAADLQQLIRLSNRQQNKNDKWFILCIISLIFLLVVFGYVYFYILRPFSKLEKFSSKIAQGDFNLPLQYERSNYFGQFTWAFDSMRQEITKARSCEREAIENNKTVIATLSHDIKTPISSIRAYAEGLEANLDNTPEKRAKYLHILMRKCDEVSKLTNDLFLHSLADLDKLKISLEEFELCKFIETVVNEITADQNTIHLSIPDFAIFVLADKNRLIQITENLINNAKKYAKSDIYITISRLNDYAKISFRDYGMGIPDEDMPFIFDKFYRGRNCGKEQGSGLGLYIVKYITEQMGGNILLHNHHDGLDAVVSLPVARL